MYVPFKTQPSGWGPESYICRRVRGAVTVVRARAPSTHTAPYVMIDLLPNFIASSCREATARRRRLHVYVRTYLNIKELEPASELQFGVLGASQL